MKLGYDFLSIEIKNWIDGSKVIFAGGEMYQIENVDDIGSYNKVIGINRINDANKTIRIESIKQ